MVVVDLAVAAVAFFLQLHVISTVDVLFSGCCQCCCGHALLSMILC